MILAPMGSTSSCTIPIANNTRGCSTVLVKGCEGTFGHPGYVWCVRREAVEGTNGLIETAAVGAGGHHMACALVGEAKSSFPNGVSEGYARPIFNGSDVR